MPNPLLAYHLILTAYGFWLPNDPRAYVHNAIDYVRRNPVREQMNEQHWKFVVPYAG